MSALIVTISAQTKHRFGTLARLCVEADRANDEPR
jgi:hypothetical protein